MPYSGTWWQMDAVDANGDTYLMCWYEESVDVDDEDGSVSLNYYKPDVILLLED